MSSIPQACQKWVLVEMASCGQQKKRCFSLNKSSYRSVAMKLDKSEKTIGGITVLVRY